jgi:hypothetical protein
MNILLIGPDLTASSLRPYTTCHYIRVAGYNLIRVSRGPDNRWRVLRFRDQIRKRKKQKQKKRVHGTFQGLGEGLNRRYRPAARNVATLLTETFILAIEHPIKTVSGPPVG